MFKRINKLLSNFSTIQTSSIMKNKVCFVTGAGSGIGKAIALKYTLNGATVISADINLDSVKQTVKEMNGGLALKVDVTNENQVNEAVAESVKQYGRLDVMVCNAGLQLISPVHELSYENWKKVISVNLDGAFLCSKAALNQMYIQENKFPASIIYIGSVHSKTASPLKAPYVSAKHGLLGLSRVIAKEAIKYNVRTNVICPGFVMTPLVSKQIPEISKAQNITEEQVKSNMLKETIDQEFTSLDDIAELCVTVATWKTNVLSGQSIIASHGWVME